MTCYCMPSIFAPFTEEKTYQTLSFTLSVIESFFMSLLSPSHAHTHDSSFYGTSDWIVWEETYSHCCCCSVWAQWQIFDFIPSKCFSLYASCTLVLPFLIVTLHHSTESLPLINDTCYWSNFSSLLFLLSLVAMPFLLEKYCLQSFELTIVQDVMRKRTGSRRRVELNNEEQ